MPRVSYFHGIAIEMYYGDHPPPHFHARYGGEAAKVAIESGLIVAGDLPVPVLRLVRKWVRDHRAELEENWERVADDEKPKPIEQLN